MKNKNVFYVEPIKNFKVIKFGTYYLSSKYNPEKEAARKFNKIKNLKTVFLFGIGSGYLIKQLVFQKNTIQTIIIFEKSYDLIALVSKLHNINFNNFTNIHILSNDFSAISRQLNSILNIEHILSYEIIKNKIQTEKINNTYYDEIENLLLNSIRDIKTNFLTMLHLEKEWNKNALINLKHFSNSLILNNLIGKYESVPCVLIGAGPSVDKNISILNNYKDKCIIVAVDTSLKTCINNDLIPDFVYSLDCNKANYEDFAGVYTENLRLIYDIVTYPLIIDNFKGIKYLSITGHENYTSNENLYIEYIKFYDWFKTICNINLPYIQTGGSVSHSSFDFLRLLGCNPIIMIGQDLAYSNFKDHSNANTNYTLINKFLTCETNYFNSLSNKNLFTIEGYFDDYVFTDTILYGYLKWFQDAGCKLKDKKILINSTECGANIKYFKNMKFEDSLKKYCKDIIDKNFESFTNYIFFDRKLLNEKIKDKIIRLKNTIELCKMGLEKIQKFYKDDKEKSLNVLDKFCELVKSNEPHFITTFLKDYQFRIFPLKKEKKPEYEMKLIKYAMFYKLMIEAAEFYLPYFKNFNKGTF